MTHNEYTFIFLESCSVYADASKVSIADCFVTSYDIKLIIDSVNPQIFKFPTIPANLISLLQSAPSDISININESHVAYYHHFLDQANNWIKWYDEMIAVLIHVVHWLKGFQIENAISLYADLHRARDKSKITVTEMKTFVQKTFALAQPFKDLRGLCSMMNCLIPFQILHPATVNKENTSSKFIEQVKRSHPDNFFKILAKENSFRDIKIQERQHIQWFIASERLEITVRVTFTPDDNHVKMERLSLGDEVNVERHTIEGDFETLSSGILTIEVNNERGRADRVVWFRVKPASLSKSHLFEGIFNMIYS